MAAPADCRGQASQRRRLALKLRRLPTPGPARPMDIFIQQVINGLTLGAVYALVALGYTMVYGIIGLINFAHGEVVMIGAMVAFSVMMMLIPSGIPPVLLAL